MGELIQRVLRNRKRHDDVAIEHAEDPNKRFARKFVVLSVRLRRLM